MKQRLTTLLICALLLSFSGCSAVAPENPQVPAAAAPVASAANVAEITAEKPAPLHEPTPTYALVPVPSGTELLTEEEIRDIALAHVGITADQAQRLRVEYERDDGVLQYDVEFHDGKLEYEFEIHAETGVILSYDRDRLGD